MAGFRCQDAFCRPCGVGRWRPVDWSIALVNRCASEDLVCLYGQLYDVRQLRATAARLAGLHRSDLLEQARCEPSWVRVWRVSSAAWICVRPATGGSLRIPSVRRGKVAAGRDRDGNHNRDGLHVFFFNYANLFAFDDARGGVPRNLLPKDHTTCSLNKGGDLRELDFRFLIRRPVQRPQGFLHHAPARLDRQARKMPLALGHQPDRARLIDYERLP